MPWSNRRHARSHPFQFLPRDAVQQSSEGDGSLIILALLALVAGAAAGLAGGIFRLALEQADRLRNLLIGWAHGQGIAGLLFVVVSCSVATFIAAWLVRRFSPHAAGSGIPHVEAVLRAQLPPARYGLAPVKFVGGLLAIGSGLALGREGPSVQMGASIAIFIDRVFPPRAPAKLLARLGRRSIFSNGSGPFLPAA
jgi:chloride channel protein, CIC family